MRFTSKKAAIVLGLGWLAASAGMVSTQMMADDAPAAPRKKPPAENRDESKVPPYQLPDPLLLSNGQRVTDAQTWTQKRRPEILELFRTEMFGRQPPAPKELKFKVFDETPGALGGKAIRKQVTIYFSADEKGPQMDLLLYIPASAKGPVPAFIGLNFGGNQAINADPGIKMSESWQRDNKERGVVNNRATEATRGTSSNRWDVDAILDRGYAVATAYYGDIDPDYDDGFQNGVHPLFYKSGETKPGPDGWGSIAAWAWGLSRALDYLERDPAINAKQVAVMGHSRLGKTALWAGAEDERFAIVISNNSGCGGAKLSRRVFGESVHQINYSFPHWFCDNFEKYNEHVNDLPIDQHELIALMAPRPVYVASAERDLHADPRGEFLSALNAEPVYRLFGAAGLGSHDMPPLNQPLMGTIGYHIRSGVHDVTPYDWQCYLDFADMHFGRKKVNSAANSPAKDDRDAPKKVARTYTYKTVGELPIKADVYRLPGDDVRPVIVWIHGGGLITGGRGGPDAEQRQRFLDAGFVIVSIDYRLAPETKAAGIVEDVQDAIQWVRTEGPGLFQIDPQRLAVAGSSAGGYLTLMAGCTVEPRPQALIAISGYGDVDGAWYARPHEIYRKTRPLFTKEEAYVAIGDKETTKSITGRSNFYTYCRQNGLWPKEVVGFDPDTQPKEFNRFCPVRNVTKDYPPTLLVHGDQDIDVPYSQSFDMAAELSRAGVEHEFITLPGGGHGFGGKGLDDPDVSAAFARIEQFLKRHVGPADATGGLVAVPPANRGAGDVAVDDEHLRAAADKGLKLLLNAGQHWQENESCFSCHHQTLPMYTVQEAAPRGFPADSDWLTSEADITYAYFEERIDRMNTGKHVPGGASTLGYGLWSLMLDHRPPDVTTAAMVNYLLQTQGRPWMDTRSRDQEEKRPAKLAAWVEGLWLTNCVRPPMTESRIGTTVLAVLGAKHYATAEQRPAVEQAAQAAEEWMAKAPLRTAEDHYWRLWGLHKSDGDAATKQQIRDGIIAAQRDDGGWAQDQDMTSDAYATGQMLSILLETGTDRSDPVAQRAAAFLLRSQHADGSWFVRTRVKGKAQPYFDNGDPHGEHQFLCVAATSWATTACVRMLPLK